MRVIIASLSLACMLSGCIAVTPRPADRTVVIPAQEMTAPPASGTTTIYPDGSTRTVTHYP